MPWDELDDLEHYFRRIYAKEEQERLWARINEWVEKRHAERQRREGDS